ncbi:PPOX class F420-dependent oxidoreductase [Pseudonocardia parietis]|uniref:Pyridoxamine 5'-phosphate oxidase family protein n=1 Tax=Pseudonocardia parietis TaxID=570936 RepID=A0ABS4VRD8_9PSEU|nr:PPOX class F420-dependent oxidoreductase [Pseudonocardia parietis]MBP2366475.1 pyridoxamine 5'-phosphate oxidase family protein [Pseudonocardia parietis]
MSFSADEIAYLSANGMGRLATVDSHGQPDVVPVAVEFDGSAFWVGGGATVTATRKFRNLEAGNVKVALVIDDMPSFEPFIARGIRVYGRADGPVDRVGMVGPGSYMRIVPTISWSWNMAGLPIGENGFEPTRTVHASSA